MLAEKRRLDDAPRQREKSNVLFIRSEGTASAQGVEHASDTYTHNAISHRQHAIERSEDACESIDEDLAWARRFEGLEAEYRNKINR